MHCSNCLTSLEDGARFCSSCGKAAPPAPPIAPEPAITNVANRSASSSTGGPIIYNQSRWPRLVVPVIILALCVGGATLSTRFLREQQAKDTAVITAANECYRFDLPKRFESVRPTTIACSVSPYDKNYQTIVSVNLLPPTITEDSLMLYANENAQARSGQNISSAGSYGEFAGQPAYRFSHTSGDRDIEYTYVFDRQSRVSAIGKQYRAYLIEVQGPSGQNITTGTLISNWQWLAHDKPATLRGTLPLAAGESTCYSFSLPMGAEAGGDASCTVAARYGETLGSTIRARTYLKRADNLDAMITDWKQQSLQSRLTVKSESSVKVGMFDGRKIVFTYDKSTSNNVVVLTHIGPKYKLNGQYTEGFEISGDYGTPAEVQAFDAALQSWRWK